MLQVNYYMDPIDKTGRMIWWMRQIVELTLQ